MSKAQVHDQHALADASLVTKQASPLRLIAHSPLRYATFRIRACRSFPLPTASPHSTITSSRIHHAMASRLLVRRDRPQRRIETDRCRLKQGPAQQREWKRRAGLGMSESHAQTLSSTHPTRALRCSPAYPHRSRKHRRRRQCEHTGMASSTLCGRAPSRVISRGIYRQGCMFSHTT